jgi:hypothetical protein
LAKEYTGVKVKLRVINNLTPMNTYKVTIPKFTVEVEAENEGEAEVLAFESFNADNSPATDVKVEFICPGCSHDSAAHEMGDAPMVHE